MLERIQSFKLNGNKLEKTRVWLEIYLSNRFSQYVAVDEIKDCYGETITRPPLSVTMICPSLFPERLLRGIFGGIAKHIQILNECEVF